MLSTRTVLASTSAAALLGLGALAGPASAANNVDQQGLVNLALTDTTVQLPIAIAANVCGVAVNVLANQTGAAPVDCTATGTTEAQRAEGGPNNTRQRGLVNVAVTDTTIQVPIAIAANVCGVTVNALSTATAAAPVTCTADGVALADA